MKKTRKERKIGKSEMKPKEKKRREVQGRKVEGKERRDRREAS